MSMPSSASSSTTKSQTIDLSDFDPFHVVAADSSRSTSPHIFASPQPSSYTATAQQQRLNGQQPNLVPPVPLPSRAVSNDPLDSFASLLNLNSDPKEAGQATATTRTPSSHATVPLIPGPSALHEQVQLQHAQRHDAILQDLAREPFQPPAHISTTTIHTNLHNHNGGLRAPPRRLSGLMDPTSPLFYDANHHLSDPAVPAAGSTSTSGAPSSPSSSSVFFGEDGDGAGGGTAAFHASSPPGRAARNMRRMSQDFLHGASSQQRPGHSPNANGADTARLPTSPEWGEFFSAPPAPSIDTSSKSPTRGTKSLRQAFVASFADHTPTRRQSGGPDSTSRRSGGLTSRIQPSSQPGGTPRSYTTPAVIAGATARVDSPDLPEKHAIKLTGVRPGVQRVLEEDVAEGIRSSLPPRLKIATRWSLVYSLDQHGISLGTLYERMRVAIPKGETAGVVVAVKDERGDVFGAFVNERLHVSESYYGDGTCFVWKALPFPPDDPRMIPAIRTYRWTGRTDYLTLTQQTFLAFGGGYDGRFGLWLDERMEKGYTTRCEAFANDPLVAEKAWTRKGAASAVGARSAREPEGGSGGRDEANFEVFGLECWAIGV